MQIWHSGEAQHVNLSHVLLLESGIVENSDIQ